VFAGAVTCGPLMTALASTAGISFGPHEVALVALRPGGTIDPPVSCWRWSARWRWRGSFRWGGHLWATDDRTCLDRGHLVWPARSRPSGAETGGHHRPAGVMLALVRSRALALAFSLGRSLVGH